MFVPKVTFLSRPVAVVFCFRILPCLSICHSNLPRDIFHLGPHLSTHPQALDMNDGQCPGCPNFLLRCALPALKREVLRVSLFGGGFVCFVSVVGFIFIYQCVGVQRRSGNCALGAVAVTTFTLLCKPTGRTFSLCKRKETPICPLPSPGQPPFAFVFL